MATADPGETLAGLGVCGGSSDSAGSKQSKGVRSSESKRWDALGGPGAAVEGKRRQRCRSPRRASRWMAYKSRGSEVTAKAIGSPTEAPPRSGAAAPPAGRAEATAAAEASSAAGDRCVEVQGLQPCAPLVPQPPVGPTDAFSAPICGISAPMKALISSQPKALSTNEAANEPICAADGVACDARPTARQDEQIVRNRSVGNGFMRGGNISHAIGHAGRSMRERLCDHTCRVAAQRQVAFFAPASVSVSV
eukprot:scaffold123845_cov33-Tisochrysis_lutea.AAC.4